MISFVFLLCLLPRALYLPSPDAPFIVNFLSFASHILCLQAFFPIPSIFYGFNAVSWSISVEAFFYLCFPFLMRLSFSRLFSLLCLVLISVFFLSFTFSYIQLPGFGPDKFNSVVWEGFSYINPFFRLPEFLIGVLMSKI